MEVNMSQLGYLYSVATRQYQETHGEVTVAYSSKENQIDPALDGVRNFISNGNYNLSIEERQKMMSSYSDVLTKLVSSNEVSEKDDDNDIEQIEMDNSSDDNRADMISGESIISDLTYGKHGREYLFSYDETGMTVIDLRNGDEMWGLNFETPDQYNQVKEFLDTLDPEENLTFTCNETFWTRFLSGGIDVDDFKYTLENFVKDGKPDFTYQDENGNMRTSEAMFRYMNIFGGPVNPFENLAKTGKTSFSALKKEDVVRGEYCMSKWFGHKEEFISYFYNKHPSEIGKRSFQYEGTWKSIEEIIDMWTEQDQKKPHYKDNYERAAEGYYKEHPETRGKKLFEWEGSLYTYEDFLRLSVKETPDPVKDEEYWKALDMFR